jgi:DNA-directed RNA polymerase subunit A"
MDTPRFFTKKEMQMLLDIVPLSKSIPFKAAMAQRRKTQTAFKKHLEAVKLRPSKFTKFLQKMVEKYQHSMSVPGESVGILCAQSIGQMNTQMTLNSFHSAGISEADLTVGVPKMQELLSATRNPKITNTTIYFVSRPKTLLDVIFVCAGKLKCLTLSQIIKNWSFFQTPSGATIEFLFNWKTMYRFGAYPEDVAARIKKSFGDVHAVIAAPKTPHFSNVVLSVSLDISDDVNYLDYINEVAVPELLNVVVSGIKGIDNIFFDKQGEGDDTEWFVQTVGSNYSKVMVINCVDFERTVSNNIWDIYERFGVEAARESLLLEFTKIMGSINTAHTLILVDRMTFGGTIHSISRYTLKNESSSALGKASFEESLENLLQASINGDIDTCTGNSASIVCGKKARAGTGFMSLHVDLNALK